MQDDSGQELSDLFKGDELFFDDDQVDSPILVSRKKTSYKEFSKSIFNLLNKLFARSSPSSPLSRLDQLESPRQRENYQKFCNLIDFSILNKQKPCQPLVAAPTSVDKEVILKRF